MRLTSLLILAALAVAPARAALADEPRTEAATPASPEAAAVKQLLEAKFPGAAI